jgi:hypothetical protein
MTLPPAPDRWTIDLANAERMETIAAFGFTERQARFLLNVLLHSGVFVERQYCSFAGIVHGQKSTDFLKRSSSGDSRRRSRLESSIVAGCSMCTTSHSGRPSGNLTTASESRPHRVA